MKYKKTSFWILLIAFLTCTGLGICFLTNPVTTEEYIKMMGVVQAKRPENSQLSKVKLNSVGIQIPTWEDALDRYLKVELDESNSFEK